MLLRLAGGVRFKYSFSISSTLGIFSTGGPRLRQNLPLPGIIGGAGPIATTQLYLDIISRCRRAGIDQRPPVLVASLRIDLALEENLLRTGEGIDGYREPLLEAADALQRAGADFLAIPCNTLHLLLPELEAAAEIPVLSIVDAVVGQAERAGCRRAGLLGTEATVRTGLYQQGMQSRGMEVVCLGHDLQLALAEQIREEVGQGATGDDDGLGDRIVSFFHSREVGALVAGCTELKALMAGWTHSLPVIDSLDALGEAVVREMLGARRGTIPAERG
jgi:aspartate racemase